MYWFCLNIVNVLSLLTAQILLSQEAGERLRLIQAGSFSREEVSGQVVQKLVGNVKLRQGKTTILCDVATQSLSRKQYMLVGHVKIFDDEQTLLADTVFIFEKEEKQVASGNVVNITPTDTTMADRMTYFQRQRKLFSERHVRIANKKEQMALTGSFAEYWRDDRYGKVWGSPVLTNYDSLGNETSRIVADTMKIFENGDRTLAIGSVEMTQPEITATSGRAEFSKVDDLVTLLENPEVRQPNYTIRGDTVHLFLKGSELKRATVSGHALAVSDADTLNKGRWQNKLTGQQMTFYFEDKKLRRVIIDNQATSFYHIIEDDSYKGANELSGDRIEIELSDGRAQRVWVSSHPDVAEGKYLPPK